MSKVIDSLEKVLLPFAVKIGKQPHINAIKNGFIKLMPLTLAGAMFVLINNVFLSFGEGSFFYSMGIRTDASTIETLNGFKAIGGNVYNGTLGIMSLMAPFFIGSALAEERKVDPMAAGLLAVAAFMTVTPYSVGEAYAVGANWLGGQNIISGMIIGLVVAELFTFVIRRNWVIRLPDSVPGSVSRSFSALIPGFLILSIFGIISWAPRAMAATSTRSSWTLSRRRWRRWAAWLAGHTLFLTLCCGSSVCTVLWRLPPRITAS